MKNTAVCHGREDLYQDLGTVAAGEKNKLLVRNDTGLFHARRAASCLIEPETGDLVLFCAAGGVVYILAVLERKGRSAATISLDGDINIQLDSGRLGINAVEGVDLASARKISMTSPELEVKAAAADLTVSQTSFTGAILQASLEKIKLFAGSFDSLLERFYQRVKRSYRFVEETDQVRADNIDHRAEKLLNFRGKNAVVNARELVKIDGDQIHFG